MFLAVLLSLFGTIAVLPVLFILYVRHRQSRPYWKERGVPQVSPRLEGSLRQRLKAPFHDADFSIYRQMKSDTVSVAGIMELGTPALFVTDPDLIKGILVKDFDHFVNRPIFDVGSGDPYFHKMLFNAVDEEWKGLRVTMSPAFTSAKIRRMYSFFTESATLMVKSWETVDSSAGVNVQEATGKFTLNVIASTAFGFDSKVFTDENPIFLRMSRRITDALAGSPFTVFKFLLLVFFPRIFKLFRLSVLDPVAISFFVDITQLTIDDRERQQRRREDFLQLMIDAKSGQLVDEGDSEDSLSSTQCQKLRLTNDLILAQCILFFNAGFDTVQALLDFCLYELALNPDVQEKLFQELTTASENQTEPGLTYETISRCSYLDMVTSETLRKYPPAFRLARKCTTQYTFPTNLTIDKGTGIVIPVMPIHYDPYIYPEPDRFNPERFSLESKAARHAAHYLPFGIGQRACIANRFALLEGKVAIAWAVLNFRFEPTEKTVIPMRFLRSVSGLKPDGGIWLQMTTRQ